MQKPVLFREKKPPQSAVNCLLHISVFQNERDFFCNAEPVIQRKLVRESPLIILVNDTSFPLIFPHGAFF